MDARAGSGEEFDAKGHRSRLRERLLDAGPQGFHDYELVEYLLTLTIPRVDTKPLAKRLLHDFGGIGPLLGASADSLRREGLTDLTIAALKIAEATALRLLEAPAPVVELGRARRLSNRRHGPPTDGGGPDPVPQRQEHAARATKARRAIAVADAEQAIRFIRSHSSQYAVATSRVGVIFRGSNGNGGGGPRQGPHRAPGFCYRDVWCGVDFGSAGSWCAAVVHRRCARRSAVACHQQRCAFPTMDGGGTAGGTPYLRKGRSRFWFPPP